MVVLNFLELIHFLSKLHYGVVIYSVFLILLIGYCLTVFWGYRLTAPPPPRPASHHLISLWGQWCYSISFLILKLVFFLFLLIFVVLFGSFGSQTFLLTFQRTSFFFPHYFSGSNFIDSFFLFFPFFYLFCLGLFLCLLFLVSLNGRGNTDLRLSSDVMISFKFPPQPCFTYIAYISIHCIFAIY